MAEYEDANPIGTLEYQKAIMAHAAGILYGEDVVRNHREEIIAYNKWDMNTVRAAEETAPVSDDMCDKMMRRFYDAFDVEANIKPDFMVIQHNTQETDDIQEILECHARCNRIRDRLAELEKQDPIGTLEYQYKSMSMLARCLYPSIALALNFDEILAYNKWNAEVVNGDGVEMVGVLLENQHKTAERMIDVFKQEGIELVQTTKTVVT
jgi:hypothetical protein